jgi:hypothetical protein
VYRPRVLRRAALGLMLLAAASTPARADGDLDLLSPRAIGHAGASLVSDDGPAALFACPASLARRADRRVQLAGGFVDDDVWLAGADHPRVGDRGPAETVPLLGAVDTFGPLVVGLAFATTASIDRRLPVPEDALPAATVIADYPHRYAGFELRHRRHTLAAGAAVRPTEWLALGATLTASRIEALEARRVWAGFEGRDPLGDPARDVTITADAVAPVVPGGALGALVAPVDVPLELALGVAWTTAAEGDGDVSAIAVRTPPTVEAGAATATFRTPSILALHAGVRWVGARYTVEAGASAWQIGDGASDAWTLSGVRIVDDSGATADLTRFATRAGRRSHGALRASGDLEVLPGFLWLSAGYAWHGAGQSRRGTTLSGVDPGGHTLALGAEITAGNAVITVGWSRQLARTVTVGEPALPFDSPFAGGTAAANLGEHGQARDHVGLGLEVAFP